jgi:hypothetical protein
LFHRYVSKSHSINWVMHILSISLSEKQLFLLLKTPNNTSEEPKWRLVSVILQDCFWAKSFDYQSKHHETHWQSQNEIGVKLDVMHWSSRSQNHHFHVMCLRWIRRKTLFSLWFPPPNCWCNLLLMPEQMSPQYLWSKRMILSKYHPSTLELDHTDSFHAGIRQSIPVIEDRSITDSLFNGFSASSNIFGSHSNSDFEGHPSGPMWPFLPPV